MFDLVGYYILRYLMYVRSRSHSAAGEWEGVSWPPAKPTPIGRHLGGHLREYSVVGSLHCRARFPRANINPGKLCGNFNLGRALTGARAGW